MIVYDRTKKELVIPTGLGNATGSSYIPTPTPSEDIEELKRQIAELKNTIETIQREYARLDGATFTGPVKVTEDAEIRELWAGNAFISGSIHMSQEVNIARPDRFQLGQQLIDSCYARLDGAAFTGDVTVDHITVEKSAQFNNSIDVANPELFTIGPDTIDTRYVLRDEL